MSPSSRLLRIGHQSAALVVGHPVAGARLDQRQVLSAHRPQRAAHREVFDQRAALVELGVQIGDREAGQPRPQRQIWSRRVGGVQPDEIGHYVVDRTRRAGQEMPPREPRSSFLHRE
jgi:hypothetical protein